MKQGEIGNGAVVSFLVHFNVWILGVLADSFEPFFHHFLLGIILLSRHVSARKAKVAFLTYSVQACILLVVITNGSDKLCLQLRTVD